MQRQSIFSLPVGPISLNSGFALRKIGSKIFISPLADSLGQAERTVPKRTKMDSRYVRALNEEVFEREFILLKIVAVFALSSGCWCAQTLKITSSRRLLSGAAISASQVGRHRRH